MHVEPDAVASAMRQSRHRVARSETACFDNLARGGIHGLTGRADLRRLERRGLRLFLQIPHLTLASAWFAEYIAAGDVGVIPFDGGACIDQNHVPLLER